MSISKTAAGGGAIAPEVMAFGSSQIEDARLYRADVLGSAAHITMLGECAIVAKEDATTLRTALLTMAREAPALPPEEDVHMAVEVYLATQAGPVGLAAPHLHTARSRNDQVATTLRLFARDACVQNANTILKLVETLIARAHVDGDVPMPAYTHRQQAQAVTFGFWLLAYAEMFTRDVEAWILAAKNTDACPLGSGAIAGTTLPIDRARSAALLGFSRMTPNALDAVGDRDFILDNVMAASRFGMHASRFSADMVDFATSEFAFIELGGAIASGSSMMPQKRNPDVFELVRGRSAAPIGALMQMFTLLKGLPAGYNRDLQEDRGPLYAAIDQTQRSASMLAFALPHVTVKRDNLERGLHGGATQATDVAEALVKRGIPFREAYKLVGAMVHAASEAKIELSAMSLERAQGIDSRIDAGTLALFQAQGAPDRRTVNGGPAAEARLREVEALREQLASHRKALCELKTLDNVADLLAKVST